MFAADAQRANPRLGTLQMLQSLDISKTPGADEHFDIRALWEPFLNELQVESNSCANGPFGFSFEVHALGLQFVFEITST
jgi:hypothetical protein